MGKCLGPCIASFRGGGLLLEASPSLHAFTVEDPPPKKKKKNFRESQHYLSLIRFPTFWGLLWTRGVFWSVQGLGFRGLGLRNWRRFCWYPEGSKGPNNQVLRLLFGRAYDD